MTTSATDSPSRPPGHFVRGLGLLDCTMIVAGSMIGSGIFIVPADIARQLGSAGWILAVWVVTAVLTLFAALSYGELAALMPRAGGQYVYLREAYGPLWGFLYGWTLFLVIQTGTVAAVAVAFAKFLGVLVPAISESHKFFVLGPFSLSPTTLVALIVLGLLSASNATGLRAGKLVQNTFTLAKIAALLALAATAFKLGANPVALKANFGHWWQATFTQAGADTAAAHAQSLTGFSLVLVFGTAMVGSLFSCDAWNNVSFAAAEIRHPRRVLPLSLALGVGLVCFLYLLANVGYLVTLPIHGTPDAANAIARGMQFPTDDRVGTAAAQVMFGGVAAAVMAGLIMISTFGCLNGMILAGARVYYAMALDGLFFAPVGRLNRNGVPALGLVAQCIWACLLTLSGTYGQLLDYVIFAVLIFYVLVISAVFVLRRRWPEAERPYRAWGYPVVPALYVTAAALIALDLLVSTKTRGNTWPGLLLVLTGIPVYFIWRWKGRKRGPTETAVGAV